LNQSLRFLKIRVPVFDGYRPSMACTLPAHCVRPHLLHADLWLAGDRARPSRALDFYSCDLPDFHLALWQLVRSIAFLLQRK
jgi:hypothetical protein